MTSNLREPASPAELEQKLAELSALARFNEERWKLNDEIDDLTEIVVRDRLPIDHAMKLFMPALCEATGARAAWIRTYDESLDLADFFHGVGGGHQLPKLPDELEVATADGTLLAQRIGDSTVIAQRLDVAGDPFGTAAVVFDGELPPVRTEQVQILLDTFCEEIDNTLASIALSRRKSQVIRDMSEAFRHPVLDEGLRRAIEVLRTSVSFEDMMLVFRHEDDLSGRTLHYKIIKKGELVHDSMARGTDGDVDRFMRSRAFRIMSGDDLEVRERFGIKRYREEVLITGVQSARVVGRVVVTSSRGEFNTYDRDLIDRFADFLRQRIVDYNKEWKQLSTTFPRETCERLLRQEGYREQWLTPRERECAVMFCDISGFTRVSEQVLVRPHLIGKLIDTWSAKVVEIVWESGGVFDKMVGDCIIGLWGPPFFDIPPRDACLQAMDASVKIREFTRSLIHHENLPELASAGALDVATGLNWCPLFVGIFGPDEDYTGFSSGMNNTARLQGQAKAGEILCMDSLVAIVGDASRFDDWREAKVKNVEQPLRFRPLK